MQESVIQTPRKIKPSACNIGLIFKHFQLCDFLLGPVHQSETAWEPLVVGLSKRVLLRDLLNTIQSCIALQRLYSEYDELLDVCNEEEGEVMSE